MRIRSECDAANVVFNVAGLGSVWEYAEDRTECKA